MGTFITLGLGNFEIDWGKNFGFNNHSPLFIKGDLKEWLCRDFDEDSEDGNTTVFKKRRALISKLSDVVPRLELLGYTNKSAEFLYYLPVKQGYINKSELIPYTKIKKALNSLEIENLPQTYKNQDYDPGEFTRRNIIDQLNIKLKDSNKKWYLEESLEHFEPLAVLRQLAENKNNLNLPLVWDFQELVENGYTKKSDIIAPLNQNKKFILITEGTTDTKVLKKAINLLRPNISDFFTFIDMENGYPFGGTGNLYNFCRGLVKIGVLNNILVIYDNDTEGSFMFEQTLKLNLPKNVRVMKLPVLDDFTSFATAGPTGKSAEDINGRAAAIECFLDLNWKQTAKPLVRWTGYHNKVSQYQGELVQKNLYTDKFLQSKKLTKKYNFNKLNILLDKIISECVCIAESNLTNI